MNNFLLKATLVVVSIIMSILCLSACGETSTSDLKYWFSKYDKNFIAYDNNANNGEGNLDVAGNNWNFTVKKDCNIDILIRNNCGYWTSTHLYINDIEKSSIPDQFYSYTYNDLELKKGDKIRLYSKWDNHAVANLEGFTIDCFAIRTDKGTFIVDGIN